MNKVPEVWKNIRGFKGYQVSSLGRIRSLRRFAVNGNVIPSRMMNPYKGGRYYSVTLYKNRKKHYKEVHRLVALHFVPNPMRLPEVNHVKGIKGDNRASQLEWCNLRENCSHHSKSKPKTSRYVGVHWSLDANKWRASIQINNKKKHLGLFASEKEASIAYKKALLSNNLTNKYS